jgi:hypothetical protein
MELFFLKLMDQKLEIFQFPSDIIIIAYVKDGEFSKQEILSTFSWNYIDQNFIKLFTSKEVYGKDGSTWFFEIFKKRILIQKGREIFDTEEIDSSSNKDLLFNERMK